MLLLNDEVRMVILEDGYEVTYEGKVVHIIKAREIPTVEEMSLYYGIDEDDENFDRIRTSCQHDRICLRRSDGSYLILSVALLRSRKVIELYTIKSGYR